MQNFEYEIPTRIAFGKGSISKLPEELKQYASSVLLVYGGGSIKRNGIYDTVTALLKEYGIRYLELSGVDPNPRVTTVREGIRIIQENEIDALLAIGGGSTIDCAKAIAAGYYYDGDAWDMVEEGKSIEQALPVFSVLTIAATGSEMDIFSVISNEETQDKKGLEGFALYPKFSVLDPEYTYSVPAYHTAAGTADIMSHIYEVYFNGVTGTFMQDRIMEALLKTCVYYGPIAVKEPEHYDARANLMWTSSWAINGFIACGKLGAWPCHAMEHQLSAYYDVTHGHGLAILTPVWMEYILNEKTVGMFAEYGKNVFGIDAKNDDMDIAKEAIEKTRQVFIDMGLSMTLRSIGIEEKTNFEAMAEKAVMDGLEHCFVPLGKEDVVKIFERCF